MRTAIRRSLPFVVASLAVACVAVMANVSCGGGSNFNYNGDWIGNRKLARPDLTPDMAYTIGRVTVSIKGEKFEMTNMGIPTSGPARNEGDRMILHTDSLLGLPLTHSPGADKSHPDITLKPQRDGTLLFSDPMAVDGRPLKLERRKP